MLAARANSIENTSVAGHGVRSRAYPSARLKQTQCDNGTPFGWFGSAVAEQR